MASTQLSPGVVVLERDLTSVVNATVDNVAAIVGAFEKGPVEAVTTVVSEKDLLSIFGRPTEYNFEYWFSAAQYLLYGGTLKVVRAYNSSLRNAIDTAQFNVTTFSNSDTTLTVQSTTSFDVNDVLLIDAELMTVQSVSGNNCVVTRASLSTAATSHAPASAVTLIEPAGTASTLDEGATFTAVDTSLTVTSATTLGAGTNSYIRIDDEYLRVTNVVGNTLTVARAQLGTSAGSHTDGVAVTLQIVTANKTTINESTSTGVSAPLIRNVDGYSSAIESAANDWKWAARTAGLHGNSIRILATDSGADQVLFLAAPSTGAEWEFVVNAEVAFSSANIYAKIYSYTTIVTLQDDSTLVGSWQADNFITAKSGAVTGRVVAYDKESQRLEIVINAASSDSLDPSDTISELANNNGVAGTATGDSARVLNVSRQLRVKLNAESANFQANQSVIDYDGRTVTIVGVESDYDSRQYSNGQYWASIAPRPTTSAYADERGGRNDLMHVLVIDGDGKLTGTPGAVLEKHLNVSKASDARSPQGDNIYYKDVIKTYSQYLYWGAHETNNILLTDPNANGAFGQQAGNKNFNVFKSLNSIKSSDDPLNTNTSSIPLVGTKNNSTVFYSLQGGVDGYSVSRPDILGGYNLFDDAETIDIDYILMGPSMSSLQDTIAKAQHIISIATSRKDCIAFVSPYRADVIGQASTADIVQKIVDYAQQLSSSSYAVIDNNYKYIYDKYNDVYRFIPCNADTAGLVLSTTLQSEAWYSPAGFNRGRLRNAIKLAYSPLKNQRDLLYAARVNPIVAFPGQGIILFGDKTALGYQSAFDRINVRRLFLVIEEAIAEAAKSQLFELNDEFTRQQFKNVVEPYLRSVQSRRGILDFLVQCDGTNNPAEAIDRGEFYAEIFVKPTRSINFITLTFTATRTGASFNEIVGS